MGKSGLDAAITAGAKGPKVVTLETVFDVLVEIRDAISAGNFSREPGLGVPAGFAPIRPTGEAPSISSSTGEPLLSDAVQQYVAGKAYEVTQQHLEIVKLTLEQFAKGVGRAGVADVNQQDVLWRRQALLDAGRTVKTVNNHMSTLRAFFEFCRLAGWRRDNPAHGLKLRNKGRAANERKAFTREQIAEVFDGIGSFGAARTPGGSTARLWIPLIMLYTGARPEEVAQLYVGDVRREPLPAPRSGERITATHVIGQWVFDFATLEDGQRRKNEASRRLVPVHPRLWELGLLSLLPKLDRDAPGSKYGAADRRLFPELSGDRLALAPSRWFNETWLRDRKGITDKKLTLYSLRHSVITQLKHSGTQESLIAQLVGHADSSQTTGRYGKAYPVEQLVEVVNSLKWDV